MHRRSLPDHFRCFSLERGLRCFEKNQKRKQNKKGGTRSLKPGRPQSKQCTRVPCRASKVSAVESRSLNLDVCNSMRSRGFFFGLLLARSRRSRRHCYCSADDTFRSCAARRPERRAARRVLNAAGAFQFSPRATSFTHR